MRKRIPGDDTVPGSELEKLEQLFSAAVEKASWAERDEFLDSACGDDPDLRTHVRKLLKTHERVGSFLDGGPVDPNATLELAPPSHDAGTRIGPYRILQEIGEGGFGVVHMAEQTEPLRRQVALKTLKLGMDTKQVLARFEAERQALAVMDHPNIARVLDAGATPAGRPYFVMELVKGVTITAYCEKNKLSIRERLELFLPVCQAVQHAHQKGIIHRDLKPNNVLVTLHDGRPVPKVIDFGIAKATSRQLTDKTLFTEFRQFLGTPEYMSPDQADISGLDVDTRTDIYSLGVLLYELLTRTTPFDAKTLRAAPYEEIRRIIQEVEPPTPSVRLATLIATEDRAARPGRHPTEPATLSRLVRGDLDWIVMKAMEKDRTRRYETAKDLADDVGRHLRHEPVVASPPSAIYRFRKFIRRHRVGVLASVMVGVALLMGISLAAVGLVQANRARADLEIERDASEGARANEQAHRVSAELSAVEARKQAAKSAAANQFLQDMLRSVDPRQAQGRVVTMRHVLDEAADKINGGSLSQQPEVEAAVRMTLGETYQALGRYDVAETHLSAARAIRDRVLGEEHPETLRSSRSLAGLLRVRGRFAEAESLLRRTAETQQRVLGEEDPDTLSSMNELALALWGPERFAEAEVIHRRTLAIQRRVLGEEHVDTVESMGHLGGVCRRQGKLSEAEPLLRRALELSRRLIGEEHPATAIAMNNLGRLREDQHDYEQAEGLYRQTYELDRRILGDDHPETVIPMNNLLRVLHIQGEVAAIQPIVAERLDGLKRAADRPDPTPLALHAYAWELLNCEVEALLDPAAALSVVQRATELDGGKDPKILDTLALAFRLTGDLDQAIETQRRAIVRARASGAHDRAEFERRLSGYLLAKGDLVGAFALAWEGVSAQIGGSMIFGTAPGASLVEHSESLMQEGRFPEAASSLRACLAVRQKAMPEDHWLIAETMNQLGAAVAGEGSFAEAEPLLIEGYAAMEQDPGVPPDRKYRAIRRIIRLYQLWDRADEASRWRRRLGEEAAEGAGEVGTEPPLP